MQHDVKLAASVLPEEHSKLKLQFQSDEMKVLVEAGAASMAGTGNGPASNGAYANDWLPPSDDGWTSEPWGPLSNWTPVLTGWDCFSCDGQVDDVLWSCCCMQHAIVTTGSVSVTIVSLCSDPILRLLCRCTIHRNQVLNHTVRLAPSQSANIRHWMSLGHTRKCAHFNICTIV